MDYSACGAKPAHVSSVNLGIGSATCRQTNYGDLKKRGNWHRLFIAIRRIKVDNDLSGGQALSALLIYGL